MIDMNSIWMETIIQNMTHKSTRFQKKLNMF